LLKNLLRSVYYKSKGIYINLNPMYKNSIRMHWSFKDNNFGDVLNPILILFLANIKAIPILSRYYSQEHFLVVGSILQYATKHSIVWGSGFISESSHCIEKPLKIHAVRGPLTRKKLIEDGIECPEVYGDPAMLLPLVYAPKIEKKYKIGIVPHYVDKNHSWIKNICDQEDVLIIDVINEDPLKVVDKIISCKTIVSSSLHGLIISDAYKIPSLWIEFSGKLIGGHFKFNDYYHSINYNNQQPFIIENETMLEELLNFVELKKIELSLQKLLLSSPFRIKKEILNKAIKHAS